MKFSVCSLVVLVALAQAVRGWWFSSENNVTAEEDVSELCLRQANWGRCEFYECLERRFPCREEGYATYIGLHFCNKIVDMFDDFTERGRQWMNGTSRCLAANLLAIYNSDVTTCSAIKDAGAVGLTSCNARVESDGSDFCGFVRENKDAYQAVFGTSDIGRMVSMRKPGVLIILFIDGASCGANELINRLSSVFGPVGDLVDSVGQTWRRMVDWWNNRVSES